MKKDIHGANDIADLAAADVLVLEGHPITSNQAQ